MSFHSSFTERVRTEYKSHVVTNISNLHIRDKMLPKASGGIPRDQRTQFDQNYLRVEDCFPLPPATLCTWRKGSVIESAGARIQSGKKDVKRAGAESVRNHGMAGASHSHQGTWRKGSMIELIDSKIDLPVLRSAGARIQSGEFTAEKDDKRVGAEAENVRSHGVIHLLWPSGISSRLMQVKTS